MGRLPVIQNDAGPDSVGRDHNTYGFSMWLAGGGIKGGYVHGATDEFGHKAVEDVVNHYDYHATLLHLFGLDQSGWSITATAGTSRCSTISPDKSCLNILLESPAISTQFRQLEIEQMSRSIACNLGVALRPVRDRSA